MDNQFPDFRPVPLPPAPEIRVVPFEKQYPYAPDSIPGGDNTLALTEHDPGSTIYNPDADTQPPLPSGVKAGHGAVQAALGNEDMPEQTQITPVSDEVVSVRPEAPGSTEAKQGAYEQQLKLTTDQAEKLAEYLATHGCNIVSKPPQDTNSAERDHLSSAQKLVATYVEQAAGKPDGTTAVISESLHTFEAATAGSLDEVRANLDKYDHLHPAEDPEAAFKRKQEKIERWVDTGILQEHHARDAALAPEVSSAEHAPPEGFKPTRVQSNPVRVEYQDPAEAVTDLFRYNSQMSPSPQDWTNAIPPEQATRVGAQITQNQGTEAKLGDFSAFGNFDGNGCSVVSNRLHASNGVAPMERFAHVVGQPVGYAREHTVTFRCPAPDNHTTPAPIDQLTSVMSAATGRSDIIGGTRNKFVSHHFDLPNGGNIRFGGDINGDGNISPGHGDFSRYDIKPDTACITVTVELSPSSTIEERAAVADRLSAWMSVWAGDQPRKPAIPS
jgi:hypothetical protein